MISVTAFIPQDADSLKDLLPCFEGEDDIFDKLKSRYGSSDSIMYTILDDDSVIGVLGLTLSYVHCASVWSVLSKKIRKYPKGYHKLTKQLLDEYQVSCEIDRLQVTVDADNEKALKQNKLWGFEVEGLMRKAGPNGKDQYLLARVR
jgi:hypothetical protein